MAEQYGVGIMTIQRALRESQQMKLTYSVAGRGTFIYPDFADMRNDASRQLYDHAPCTAVAVAVTSIPIRPAMRLTATAPHTGARPRTT